MSFFCCTPENDVVREDACYAGERGCDAENRVEVVRSGAVYAKIGDIL